MDCYKITLQLIRIKIVIIKNISDVPRPRPVYNNIKNNR
jgi:hypothetical protein